MAIRRNTKSSPGFTIFFGIIWVIIAIVVFSVSSSTRNMHKRCTKSTTGVVQSVSSERRTKKQGKHRRVTYYVYRTSYAFDANNKTVYGTSTLSASQRLDEGATLTVNYNPSNPEKDHFTRYDDSGTGGMIVSGFLGVIGIIVVISGFSQKAKGGSGMRSMAAGAVLSGMNNNNNYNYNNLSSGYNNNYGNGYNNNNYNNGYNNSYNNGYNNNNYNNGYNNNNYNNGYNNNNYNNGYNNSYDNGYNNNNYNNGYNNSYDNGYNNNNYNNGYNNNSNNNVYSGGNDYNDFNQLN